MLIVPLMLALVTVIFTWQQEGRQQRTENQRAEAERELAEQRTQDEALQTYIDQMGQLVLEEGLRGATAEDSEVATLARARTLTVLQRLEDANHKRSVMRFLAETELIQKESRIGPVEGGPIISLRSADLSGAYLMGGYLIGADLREANLSGAKLRNARLRDADLRDADLGGADLGGERGANLRGANLRGANLKGAEITKEQLAQAEFLEGAIMPNGQEYEDWLKSRRRGEAGE